MSEYNITGLREKVSKLINGNRSEDDKYYRRILSVSGYGIVEGFTILYAISYSKTYSSEERGQANAARAIKSIVKIFTGGMLITPTVQQTENTYCKIHISIISVHDNTLYMSYGIQVQNGSFLHKRMVQEMEETGFFGQLRFREGFIVSESKITIDLEKAGWFKGKSPAEIMKMYVFDDELIV